jgi:uncharacterized membrane protein SirB2
MSVITAIFLHIVKVTREISIEVPYKSRNKNEARHRYVKIKLIFNDTFLFLTFSSTNLYTIAAHFN